MAAAPALARDVRDRVPAAWGRLAAAGVTAHKAKLGRALRDDERRAVWSALWREAHR